MGNKRIDNRIKQGMGDLGELKLLEELDASEEFFTPFYWIDEGDGYGKLTSKAEEIALKYLKPKEDCRLLFKKEDVQQLFQGWGMIVF